MARISPIRLGVNIDHVATLRNARGGMHPDPLRAALVAAEAGADGITAHLREDRRHIRDEDIARLMSESKLPLNLEMAATEEMVAIALQKKPHAVCIVPEKREERTTEGGLDVVSNKILLKDVVAKLGGAGIRVSLFISPSLTQVEAAQVVGAQVVELHTGRYCEPIIGGAPPPISLREISPAKSSHSAPPCSIESSQELERIRKAAGYAAKLGLECHAGHGLSFDTVAAIAAIPDIVELNIGHFLVGEAVFLGLKESIQHMKKLMSEARR